MTALEDLDIALRLADVADSLSEPAFGTVVGERKADGSAVSVVDREIERQLRSRLSELAPTDAVVGEELGGMAAGGSSLDPRSAGRDGVLRARDRDMGHDDLAVRR